MAGQIVVSSTTDSQDAVNAAAEYGNSQPEKKKVEQSSEALEAESVAESETAKTEEEPQEEEPKEEEGEEEEPEVVDKHKKKLLRQINRLTGQRYSLQEQLDEVREQLRKVKEGGGGGQQQQAAPQPGRPKPDPKDAKYKGRPYEEFVEDFTDWKVEQREIAKAIAEQQAYVRGIFDDYNASVARAREKIADFDEVVGKDNVPVPLIAINAMYELENGPEVAYYLARHPDVREQLLEWNEPNVRGGVRKIMAALDRISEQLSPQQPASGSNNGSPQRPRPVSPPAPIKPLGGASATRTSVPMDEMPYQEYKRAREAEIRGRRR